MLMKVLMWLYPVIVLTTYAVFVQCEDQPRARIIIGRVVSVGTCKAGSFEGSETICNIEVELDGIRQRRKISGSKTIFAGDGVTCPTQGLCW